MGEKITTLKVTKRNRDRLAKFGDVGESFDVALDRVLSIAEEHEKEKRKQNPLEAVLVPALA